MTSTYSSKELFAHAMHDRPGCFFTAAGGNGYRLYVGTAKAMSFQGFYSTQAELFAAADTVNA